MNPHGAIRAVVELLVAKDYLSLERMTMGSRLSASEIEFAVNDYGRTLVTPPDAGYELVDVVRVDGEEDRLSVRFPLWTIEEGRSDLTLEITLTAGPDGYAISLDDLHVL